MKHGRCIFISVITHINAVEKQRVEMLIEAQVTGGALNDGEAAALLVVTPERNFSEVWRRCFAFLE